MAAKPAIGDRTPRQEELFPRDAAVPFDALAADRAAALYADLPRARGRDLDLAIAACAIVHEAALWTLNPEGLRRHSGAEAAVDRLEAPVLRTVCVARPPLGVGGCQSR